MHPNESAPGSIELGALSYALTVPTLTVPTLTVHAGQQLRHTMSQLVL